MDEEIVLSIIIPVYNTGDYLNQCINSVILESANYEIIIVNDDSDDHSQSIIDKYISEYCFIKSFKTERIGLSEVRNFGIKKSKGKYLLFLDSDDFFLNNSVEYIYNHVCGLDDDIILFDALMYDNNNGNYLKYFDSDLFYCISKISNINRCRKILLKMEPAAWKKIYRKEFIADTIFPKNLIFEDLPFHLSITDNFKSISFLKNCSIVYRINREGQITSNDDLSLIDFFDIIDIVFKKKYKFISIDEIFEIYKRYVFWMINKRIFKKKVFRNRLRDTNRKYFNWPFYIHYVRECSLYSRIQYWKIILLRYHVTLKFISIINLYKKLRHNNDLDHRK